MMGRYQTLLSTATCGTTMWGWAVSILENAQEGVQWSNIHVNLFDGTAHTGPR